jgi:hypothetical protein
VLRCKTQDQALDRLLFPLTYKGLTPMHVEDSPAWDVLCALTTDWLLNAHSPTEERAVWQLKLKCRRIWENSQHPDVMAAKMLAILTKPQRVQKAA